VQCVGVWANDKHFYLRQYIEATRSVRARYLPPTGQGGAAFVDLFAGPGRARIRETREFIDGSPLIALRYDQSPFSKVIMCDIDAENLSCLRQRTAGFAARAEVIAGDCNAVMDRILQEVPQFGLNIALVDPFGGRALSFDDTLRRLGSLPRMDLIIHFPTGGFKRNFKKKPYFESFLGLPAKQWGVEVTKAEHVPRLIEVLKRQLTTLGYKPYFESRTPGITNTKNVVLYNLVYASKHERGEKIWKSITKHEPSGQRGFAF
jgi:three-Cys-motif partner protein